MSEAWGMSRMDKLALNLTQILTDLAPKLGLEIFQDGYINLDDTLKKLAVFNYTVPEVTDCVKFDEDQRFELKTDKQTNAILIRCKDGHSFPFESANANGGFAEDKDMQENGANQDGLHESQDNYHVINANEENLNHNQKNQNGFTPVHPAADTTVNKACNGIQTLEEVAEDILLNQNEEKPAPKQNGQLATPHASVLHQEVRPPMSDHAMGWCIYWALKNGIATITFKCTEDWVKVAELFAMKQLQDLGIEADDLPRVLNNFKRLETRTAVLDDQNTERTEIRIKPNSRRVPESFVLRKTLNYILKHGIAEYGLKEQGSGFIDMDVLLQIDHKILSLAIIEDVVSVAKKDSIFELGRLNSSGDILPLDSRRFDIDPTSDRLFIRMKTEEPNANPTNPMNPVMKRLLGILRYDAPKLGLKVHTWGFISISEILNLKFKEFEGLSECELMKHVDDFLAPDEIKKDTVTTRRDPENAQDVQIRATRGHKFPIQTDAGFEHQPSGNVKLSKTLSFFLRHHAPKSVRDPFGYVQIDWLLSQSNFRGNTLEEIVELVETATGIDRFNLLRNKENKVTEIRANYGHTFEVCAVELGQILNSDSLPTLLLGSSYERWDKMKKNGIPRTTLAHIHMSCDEDHLKRCRFVYYAEYALLDVIVHVDLKKALEDGFKFFITFNGVVLCQLDKEKGDYMDPKYIIRAVNVATGEDMPLEASD